MYGEEDDDQIKRLLAQMGSYAPDPRDADMRERWRGEEQQEASRAAQRQPTSTKNNTAGQGTPLSGATNKEVEDALRGLKARRFDRGESNVSSPRKV